MGINDVVCLDVFWFWGCLNCCFCGCGVGGDWFDGCSFIILLYLIVVDCWFYFEMGGNCYWFNWCDFCCFGVWILDCGEGWRWSFCWDCNVVFYVYCCCRVDWGWFCNIVDLFDEVVFYFWFFVYGDIFSYCFCCFWFGKLFILWIGIGDCNCVWNCFGELEIGFYLIYYWV